MHFALAFFLAVFTDSALASPLVQGREDAEALIDGARADLAYLDRNADKCTRFGTRLREQFLFPLSAELLGHSEKLSVLRVFQPAGPSCDAPTPAELLAAREAATLVADAITLRLQQAGTPQGQFFGYSGDQVMDLALEAGPGFPECVPEEAGNPRSTRELRTYYAMKEKFVRLKAVLETVAAEASTPSAPVCR